MPDNLMSELIGRDGKHDVYMIIYSAKTCHLFDMSVRDNKS